MGYTLLQTHLSNSSLATDFAASFVMKLFQSNILSRTCRLVGKIPGLEALQLVNISPMCKVFAFFDFLQSTSLNNFVLLIGEKTRNLRLALT